MTPRSELREDLLLLLLLKRVRKRMGWVGFVAEVAALGSGVRSSQGPTAWETIDEDQTFGCDTMLE
jgi:hypothetical protein